MVLASIKRLLGILRGSRGVSDFRFWVVLKDFMEVSDLVAR